MSESGLVAIIIGVLGLLGGGGFWGYRQSRKDAPVRQRDADLVVADKSQQMAMAIADDLRQDYERLRGELGHERDGRLELTGRFTALETHVREQDKTISHLRRALGQFSAAWDDLTTRWEHHRTLDYPPDRPVVNGNQAT